MGANGTIVLKNKNILIPKYKIEHFPISSLLIIKPWLWLFLSNQKLQFIVKPGVKAIVPFGLRILVYNSQYTGHKY